jgi:ABC-2 type transport system ATP-binding protein
MTVGHVEVCGAFREHWNWRLSARSEPVPFARIVKTSQLESQRTQLALITAIAPIHLLVLDEPTSGLDQPRREFIQTVIGAYQDGAPGKRTVFVSTHLIAEFEGLIDEFTIIDQGREVLTMAADAARERYQKIYVRFPSAPPALDLAGATLLRQRTREIELVVNGNASEVMSRLVAHSPEVVETEALSLEEIFVTTLQTAGTAA